MAYFPNSDGGIFDCAKCKYGDKPCPIAWVQTNWNYDACNKKVARSILDALVGNDGKCAMYQMDPEGLAANQGEPIGEIGIATKDGTPLMARVWESQNGLAITSFHGHHGEVENVFNVTHEASGRCLTIYAAFGLDAARAKMAAFLGLPIDWTQGFEAVRASAQPHMDKIRELRL